MQSESEACWMTWSPSRAYRVESGSGEHHPAEAIAFEGGLGDRRGIAFSAGEAPLWQQSRMDLPFGAAGVHVVGDKRGGNGGGFEQLALGILDG